MSKHKMIPHSFYFSFYILNSHMHSYSSIYFSLSCYIFLETIIKMKLNTLVTKYSNILFFNFAHIIYPQRCIMPLEYIFSTSTSIKVYKAFQKGNQKVLNSVKYFRLNIDLFTSNTYCTCKLLYTTVTLSELNVVQ